MLAGGQVDDPLGSREAQHGLRRNGKHIYTGGAFLCGGPEGRRRCSLGRRRGAVAGPPRNRLALKPLQTRSQRTSVAGSWEKATVAPGIGAFDRFHVS